MSHESVFSYVGMVDPALPEYTRTPESLRTGFDAVLFDKDGTLITPVSQWGGADFIEIESVSMFGDRVQVLPGRVELIHELKAAGVKLGIVTGDWKEPTEELLEKMGVRGAFDIVITDDDLKIRGKPHPEPFLRAKRGLGISNPKRCVMIGDSPDDDMRGAKRLGMRTILVPSYRWGRGWELSDQVPGPDADVVVLSHPALTYPLIESYFGEPNSSLSDVVEF